CGADTTPPAVVTDLSASGLDAQVLLDWTAPGDPDLAGFDVYRAQTSGGPYTKINGSLVTLAEFTDTGVTNGTTYYYVVVALDAAGNASADSNEASATPQAAGTTGDAWINEFHYDNDGTDFGEFVEVAGPAGLNLSGWQIVGYNGNGGAVYATLNLTGTLPDQDSGFGTLAFDFTGLQNGAPDGIALVDGLGQVIEFISYEGSFTAIDGPAAGLTSTDVGVSETSSTPMGHSLQRTGSGQTGVDFSWAAPQIDTYGAVNAGQSFGGAPPADDPPAAPTGLTASAGNKKVDLVWNANGESDLASYRIYRSQQSGGGYALIATVSATSTSFSNTGLRNGRTYYYVIGAVDAAGQESPTSAEVSATPSRGRR
ncbi:MAG: fibronectin type III domain-containing protein, partial [Wenzhouxiangellaceae bacterium]